MNYKGLRIRQAGAADASLVAALQVASWRSAYRGILSDGFLAGPVEADRAALWRTRLSGAGDAGQVVLVAEEDGGLVGLACILAGNDPRWGSLIDNLHVRPNRRRGGIGRRLLREATARMPAAHAGAAMHLTVFEENRAAQGAYDAWGGKIAERFEAGQPDGCSYPVLRYWWPSPAALLARLT